MRYYKYRSSLFVDMWHSPLQTVLLLTYLLTPWCTVLLEKLTGLQLVKKFLAFHGTRMFITVHTSVRHLSLSWASLIQSIYPHPTSWKSILILSTHLRLGLHTGLLPSGFPTKTLYTPLSSPIRATCPAHRKSITTTLIATFGIGSFAWRGVWSVHYIRSIPFRILRSSSLSQYVLHRLSIIVSQFHSKPYICLGRLSLCFSYLNLCTCVSSVVNQ